MTEQEMRELDAWIAEHVMEWQWWRFKLPPAALNSKKKFEVWCQLIPPNEDWPKTKKWGGVLCKCAIKGMDDYTDLSMFKPTTDPAAAMEVLKKCGEKDFVTIYKSRINDDWCADNQSKPTRSTTLICTANTPELAICLFAKKLFTGKGEK